jgi:hypothetical protein
MQTEGPQSPVGVAELLEQVLEQGASDLHLTAGATVASPASTHSAACPNPG